MAHRLIAIDGRQIKGWSSFHDLFTQLFGFPETYPRNMSAWMNAVYSLDDVGKGLSTLKVAPGEMLVLQIDSVDEFAEKRPQQYATIVECVAAVNLRRIEAGAGPIVCLAYFKN
jgi:hypothetical protein